MGYGWLNVVYRMSNNDVLKFNQIFELPAIEFLNYVQYLNDVDAVRTQNEAPTF